MQLVYDSLNNQFKLHDYLDNNIMFYIDNNNICVNYYCFFKKQIGNAQYILTSSTTKRKDNGQSINNNT
jgi:hypothetical protein